jgi:ankyrin repeat protein
LRGHALVVRALLTLSGGDVDVNARIAGTGMTAMHLAASAGHASSVLEMTRERRTNISATDHQGWTPLHMAC